jgi:putative Mg2+ transporter-C (MgtC) family protein
LVLDIGLQLELSGRLVFAALLGAAIGLERELHDHPAGMRTHLLVSLGSALFAVISAYGYASIFDANPQVQDSPQRIAAQIVSGIGFLGAGAIIQAGRWVRGLTTAASLWATAAVGLAVGSGEYLLAVVGTTLIVVSLGPLNRVIAARRGDSAQAIRLRLELTGLGPLGEVTTTALRAGGEVSRVETRKIGKGRYEVELLLRLPARVSAEEVIGSVDELPGVDVAESSDARE